MQGKGGGVGQGKWGQSSLGAAELTGGVGVDRRRGSSLAASASIGVGAGRRRREENGGGGKFTKCCIYRQSISPGWGHQPRLKVPFSRGWSPQPGLKVLSRRFRSRAERAFSRGSCHEPRLKVLFHIK